MIEMFFFMLVINSNHGLVHDYLTLFRKHIADIFGFAVPVCL